MQNRRWLIGIVTLAGVAMIITCGILGMSEDLNQAEAKSEVAVLPAPELSGGMRGEMGIDKNINEATIDQYLGRDDAVYRDMRMLVDEANYENIGGDSYLSGYVEGFEAVPYPLIVNVEGLPEAVGQSYTGPTLFTHNDDGYVANYEESMGVLEYFFPKDKKIFLMCGGGGYAGMMKAMLVALGWDESQIYNVGGYWYYDGEHNVKVKDGDEFQFWKVPYHEIKFEYLTPKTKEVTGKFRLSEEYYKDGGIREIDAVEFAKLVAEKKSFLVVARMTVCPAEFPVSSVAKQLAKEDDLVILELTEAEFKKTTLAEKVKYLPSVAIYRDGGLVDFLDAEADEDLVYYQSVEGLSEWLTKNGVELK